MRPITASMLIALGLTLAACSGPVNRGLSSVNQPVISRTDYVLDARANSGGLAMGEAERVTGWFDSLKLGYGDHVAVDDPAGSGASRQAIAAIAARYGLLLSASPPVSQGEPQPGSLRVIVSRGSADVPHCPNWDRKSQPEFASSTMSNYGCATNTNLAAMVADPADLVQGHEYEGADSSTGIKAIRTYRDAEPTGKPGATLGATSTNTKGGN